MDAAFLRIDTLAVLPTETATLTQVPSTGLDTPVASASYVPGINVVFVRTQSGAR